MRRVLCALAVLSGCTLDVASKPVCVTDEDCYSGSEYCIASRCVINNHPKTTNDLFYVQGTPSPAAPITVMGEVISNDSDVDGDALHIDSAIAYEQGATIQQISDTSVTVTVTALPTDVEYLVSDGITSTVAGFIHLVAIKSNETIAVTHYGALVTSVFTNVDVTQVSVITPPSNGMLVGSLPNQYYQPNDTFAGTDQATYRAHAADGDFDIVVTFEVALPLHNEETTVVFGTPTTIDVLANDEAGVTLISTSSPYATISANNMLTVDPPLGVAGSYAIPYTARDADGHEGTATLTLDVEFPTDIVVGNTLAGDSFDPVLSADGRYLAFTSTGSTVVTGDTNGASDVFVEDLETGVIERISLASDGSEANDASTSPTISADGRYVAFVSKATNLSAVDTSAVEDIYLHDRTTGTTSLISVSLDTTGSNQPSINPHISADGTRIVFASSATRLVANDTNGVQDIFVRDVSAGTTVRVSRDTAGNQVTFASLPRPRISGDGRYVALATQGSLDTASTNWGTFVVDLTDLSVSRASTTYGDFDLDNSGRHIIYGDYNETVLDRLVDSTTPLGNGTFPVLTPDATYAAFANRNTVDASRGATGQSVVVDRFGAPVLATPLRRPAISADGKWIVFATSEWPTALGKYVIVRVWNTTFAP